MSNYLAIATVTAALQQTISNSITSIFPGAVTTVMPPDKLQQTLGDAGVNVFLFQSTPNPAFRNSDQPMRRADGTLLNRPRTGLDLHYLITFFGKSEQFEPEQLFALVCMELHTNAVLLPSRLRSTARSYPSGMLEASDLDLQKEQVRITHRQLGIEDMHRFWTIFQSTPYRLSTIFVASVVLLDGPVPGESLPVLATKPSVSPGYSPPILQSLIPASISCASGTEFTLQGMGFTPECIVQLNKIAIASTFISSTRLQARLPTTLTPGSATIAVLDPTGAYPPGQVSTLTLHPNLSPALLHDQRQNPLSGVQEFVIVCAPSPCPAPGDDARLLLNSKSNGANFDTANLAFHRFWVLELDISFTSIAKSPNLSPALRAQFAKAALPLPPGSYLKRIRGYSGVYLRDRESDLSWRLSPAADGSTLVYFGLRDSDPSDSLVMSAPNVPTGEYLARFQLAGANSLLSQSGSAFTGPLVAIS